MDEVGRIKEEGWKALESLSEDYSGDELLHPEELLDGWQVSALREKCRLAYLALELHIQENNRCSECGCLVTEKDYPFCIE